MPDRTPEELCDLLTLCDVPGIGNARFTALVERFGSPGATLHAGPATLSETPGISVQLARLIADAKPGDEVKRQCDRIAELGVSVLASTDPDFPQHVAAQDDAPPLLFVKGNAGLLSLPGIAIVGTRHPTEYGRHVTATVVRALVERGMTIVSGMARGVDSLAHKVTLSKGGLTIAVLGCGADLVYPPEAKQLYARIAETGAIVSEFWLGTPPDRMNFPRRNRIISGLSRAVIITEAPARSGALITAETAARQDRDVYAVPGDITRPEAYGANHLLADGAQVITSIDDLLVSLGLVTKVAGSSGDEIALPVAPPSDLSDDDRRILDVLAIDPIHIDDIALKVGGVSADLLMRLTMMEMRGLVATHPGSRFSRAVSTS